MSPTPLWKPLLADESGFMAPATDALLQAARAAAGGKAAPEKSP